MHHPLYGNYRPYQQPYRSALLKAPGSISTCLDAMSLHLIEEALLVYSSNKTLAPEEAPASLQDACALLDCELMRLPLEQSGLSFAAAPMGRGKETPRKDAPSLPGARA